MITSTLATIIIFFLVLSVLVLVHEFGHFIIAKKSGIRVDEFGLGFPPRIKTLFRKNGTNYTLNALPFGGFVRIYGEDGEIEEGQENFSFKSKPKYIKLAVLSGGVIFNVLFAFVLLFTQNLIGVQELSQETSAPGAQLVIVEVMPDTPAEEAGLMIGDIIYSVSSGADIAEDIPTAAEFIDIINNSSGDVSLEVLRGGEAMALSVAPEGTTDKKIGVGLSSLVTNQYNFSESIMKAGADTVSLTKATAVGYAGIIKKLFTGKSKEVKSMVSGPVGIAKIVGQSAQIGFSTLLFITAIISLNLAVLNIIPFPALDGGRILFVLIEHVAGRDIPEKYATYINLGGFVILIGLIIIVTIADVGKFF